MADTSASGVQKLGEQFSRLSHEQKNAEGTDHVETRTSTRFEVKESSSFDTINPNSLDDPLKALILNLDASERLWNEVTITEVNGFTGIASLPIPKLSFVERQVEEREPHFIGISEVKNDKDQSAILQYLKRKDFGTFSVKFVNEHLVHGWDTTKYVIDTDVVIEPMTYNKNDTPPDISGGYGYGHRYIWTRLKKKNRWREQVYTRDVSHANPQKLG